MKKDIIRKKSLFFFFFVSFEKKKNTLTPKSQRIVIKELSSGKINSVKQMNGKGSP